MSEPTSGTGPMAGLKVVELALYALVPAAGAVLAGWGAEVVKIEHPDGGDPIRNLDAFGVPPGTGGFTYLVEVMNRGKQSLAVDVGSEAGRRVLLDLIADADVFLTNFLPGARRKLGIEPDDLLAVNPRLIYARGSGYGPQGAESDRGGFDGITYWQRSGVAAAATPPDSTELVTLPAPAFGDIQGAMTIAGGVSAALYQRERTGRGSVVDVSLFGVGLWAMQAAIVASAVLGAPELPRTTRLDATNPLSNTYRTADGEWIVLAMLQADRYWPQLCQVLGHPELAEDERFVDMAARSEHRQECIGALDEIFGKLSLDEAVAILQRQEGPFETVRKPGDVLSDQQAIDNGYLRTVDYPDGRSLPLVSSPVQFDLGFEQLRPAPELGEHTDDILQRLGYSWDQIIEMKLSGAVL